jgi:hypothetical protein
LSSRRDAQGARLRRARGANCSVPAFGNFGIEGATDLARENLIAAMALNPPTVRAVVHGAVFGWVQGGHVARLYSITSSARSRIDGGIARPSALAVLRFTTI